MTVRERFESDFTTVAWVLIPIGVAINLSGRFVVTVLSLPVFLDTIGTTRIRPSGCHALTARSRTKSRWFTLSYAKPDMIEPSLRLA